MAAIVYKLKSRKEDMNSPLRTGDIIGTLTLDFDEDLFAAWDGLHWSEGEWGKLSSKDKQNIIEMWGKRFEYSVSINLFGGDVDMVREKI